MKYIGDCNLWEPCYRSGSDSHQQDAAYQASAWTVKNYMQTNIEKTKYMEIYFGTVPLTLQSIVINNIEIDQATVFTLLGFMIGNILSCCIYIYTTIYIYILYSVPFDIHGGIRHLVRISRKTLRITFQ